MITEILPRVFVLSAAFIIGSVAIAQGDNARAAPLAWKQDSYAEFSRGTFSDAGANMYVSRRGRIQTINRWDYQGDGFIDILSANSHPLIEMLDLSVYWGNGKDFSIERHTYVPADGPMRVAAGDLNRDGVTDLAVANFSNGTWTSMDSAVYWGRRPDAAAAREGLWTAGPFQGKTMLPSQSAQQVIVADMNKDGWPDLVFAFSAGFWEYRGNTKPIPSRIYWNRGGVFQRDDYAELPTNGATAVDAGDINGDGWTDLAFAIGEEENSQIYLGGPGGFAADRRIDLPTHRAHAVKIADLNGDNRPEVLFANEGGGVSYAYLNSEQGFAADRRVAFPTQFAKDVIVADFNRDGHPDVFFTNHMQSPTGEERLGNRMMPSYLYWGGPAGYSAERRQSIQTIGAWGAKAADLNADGWVDLLVCNFQDAYSFEVPSFVYWNGPQGFEVTRRTPLYGHGAQGCEVADLNGDGHLDIVMTAMMGRSRGDYDPSYLYAGNARGEYSVADRVELPGREPYEQAMADLNDDGQTDVVLLNQGEVTRYENEAWIYWNDRNKLDPWRITGLPAYAGVGVEVADLDRDGYLDVIIANNRSNPGKAGGPVWPGSFIYWGSQQGWVVTERTSLNIAQTRSPSIADMNGDGHLDLVFAGEGASIFWGDGTRAYGDSRRQPIPGTLGRANHQTEVADVNQDGYLDIVFAGPKVMVYYGGADRSYTDKRRTVLAVDAKTMTIADVNADGWLDLVCPLYKSGGNRSLESVVLLGAVEGFREDRRISLPTDGGTGSIVSDFNFDGWPDLFYFCHRRDGSPEKAGQFADHATNSRLYWGGPTGFKPDYYLAIPTVGTHYDVGVDLGDIGDRRFVWHYFSEPKAAPGAQWCRLTWRGETPGRTTLRFQVRTAPSAQALTQAAWQGPDGPGTYFAVSGADLRGLKQDVWIQYRAEFDTVNGATSPILDAVQIDFN
jgi:hypothetical protein